MVKHLLAVITLCFCIHFATAQQACNARSSDMIRVINPGTGQNFSRDFICSTCFHFVQFGVYQANTDKYDIRAPQDVGEVWLIRHDKTMVKGNTQPGAYYIVKAFSSENEARLFANNCKKEGLDCWYNPNLTGTEFDLLSITR